MHSSQLNAGSSRLAVIDAFRGLAALVVCAFHARQIVWVGMRGYLTSQGHHDIINTLLAYLSAPLIFGGMAVPLFFVISGYCIHRSFASGQKIHGETRTAWYLYFMRRAWRIYPVFICAMILTAGLNTCSEPRIVPGCGYSAGSHSIQTAIWNLAGLAGSVAPNFGANFPFWSLSIELQLYAAYPLVFYLSRRWGTVRLLYILLVFSVVTSLVRNGGLVKILWFGPYWFCWTLGVLVAKVEANEIPLALGKLHMVAWGAVSLSGYVLWALGFQELAFSNMGIFWALIVLRGLTKTDYPALISRMIRIFAVFGIFSYSLYVVHEPVCIFVRFCILGGAQSQSIVIILPVIALCVGVALCSWFLVERFSLRLPGFLMRALSRTEHPAH